MAEFEEDPYEGDALMAKMDEANGLKDPKETEKRLREVMDGLEKVGREETWDYAKCMDNLGISVLEQGRREEAQELHKQALERKEKLLGPDHQSVLISRMNYAVALDDQEEREVLLRGVLADSERLLGPEHPDTLLKLDNLSRTLINLEKYQECEELALRALAGKEKVLGPDDPSTLSCMASVAVVYHHLEEKEKAEAYFKKALEGYDRVLGQDDKLTRYCWFSYLAMGTKPRPFDPEKQYAPDHPVSIIKLHDEAEALYDQGDFRQAEKLNRKALELCESTIGPGEGWTLTLCYELALTLRELWNYEEAEVLHRRSLAGRLKKSNFDQRGILNVMNGLGVVLWDQKGEKVDEAEALFRQVASYENKSDGALSVGCLNARNNLGLIEMERLDYAAAEQTYRKLLVDRENVQGPEHMETKMCMVNIAMNLGYQEKWEEASEFNQRALEGLMKHPGPDHLATLVCQSNLAKVLSRRGKLEEAEATIQSVIERREEVLGPEHGNTLKSKSRLVEIMELQGRLQEALELQEEVYVTACESLGPNHSDTQGYGYEYNLLIIKVNGENGEEEAEEEEDMEEDGVEEEGKEDQGDGR